MYVSALGKILKAFLLSRKNILIVKSNAFFLPSLYFDVLSIYFDDGFFHQICGVEWFQFCILRIAIKTKWEDQNNTVAKYQF